MWISILIGACVGGGIVFPLNYLLKIFFKTNKRLISIIKVLIIAIFTVIFLAIIKIYSPMDFWILFWFTTGIIITSIIIGIGLLINGSVHSNFDLIFLVSDIIFSMWTSSIIAVNIAASIFAREPGGAETVGVVLFFGFISATVSAILGGIIGGGLSKKFILYQLFKNKIENERENT